MQKNCSMNCKITTTPDFARDLKQLAKHYPSMKQADGLLQFVDKNDKWIDEFVKYMTDNYYGEMWTVSCNGKIVWPANAVKPEKSV